MTDYVVASFSGGKDSTAMVLHMIERGDQLDEVVNVDTGMEFPEMYAHLDRVRAVIEAHGIKYTTLRNEHSFEWYLLHKEVPSEKYGDHIGYGWPTPVIRWCTKHLKTDLIDGYFRDLRQSHTVVQCIGIAADEVKRLERPNNKRSNHRHPLAEWGWTEADCLRYCYDRGYDWGGLYRIFNRVSCWCCPLAQLSEFRKLWQYYPDLWAKLEEWDDQVVKLQMGERVKFWHDCRVRDLTRRFEREAYSARCQTNLLMFADGGGRSHD